MRTGWLAAALIAGAAAVTACSSAGAGLDVNPVTCEIRGTDASTPQYDAKCIEAARRAQESLRKREKGGP